MLSLLRQSTISVRVGVAFVGALQESILKAICYVSWQFLTFDKQWIAIRWRSIENFDLLLAILNVASCLVMANHFLVCDNNFLYRFY